MSGINETETPPTKLWCEHVWLGGERVESGVVLSITGEQISAVHVARPTPPPDADIALGLTIPGMANAHSHAFHRALRGRTHGGTGTFWTWRDQMYRLAASLTPDAYLDLATATYAEMALAGITCVGEFHYLHHGPDGDPYDDPNEMSVMLVEAARRAGIRITLLDTCYLHGGIGAELNAVQRRFSDGNAYDWTLRAMDAGDLWSSVARTGAAIHSVRAVDPASMATVAAFDGGVGVLHAHVSEQPAENADCQHAYGGTPVEMLASAGALGSRFTAVHATHLSANDVALLGTSRSTVCLCPTTERDLGDGIGRVRDLHKAKARLAVGSDSHAVIDLFEEARGVEFGERLTSLQRGRIPASDLLAAATSRGYASLGWSEAGTIAEGSAADLCVVSLDSVRLSGVEQESILPAVVFAATAADVTDVMVAGQWTVRNGEHERIPNVVGALRSAITRAWQLTEAL